MLYPKREHAAVRKQERKRYSAQDLRDFYGEAYVSAFQTETRRLRRLVRFMRLEPHMVVADFACGSGLLLREIHHRVGFYHGIDFSSEFIEQAQRHQKNLSIKNASFHCESIVDFCSRHPHEMDRAFAMDFSEHIYDHDFVEIFQAIHSTLKRDGRLYLHTPNAAFFLEILKAKGILPQIPGHIAVRHAIDTIKLLKIANFKEVDILYLPHYMWQMAWLHPISSFPMLGKYFRARFFLDCRA